MQVTGSLCRPHRASPIGVLHPNHGNENGVSCGSPGPPPLGVMGQNDKKVPSHPLVRPSHDTGLSDQGLCFPRTAAKGAVPPLERAVEGEAVSFSTAPTASDFGENASGGSPLIGGSANPAHTSSADTAPTGARARSLRV